jgi:hypothetical protein
MNYQHYDEMAKNAGTMVGEIKETDINKAHIAKLNEIGYCAKNFQYRGKKGREAMNSVCKWGTMDNDVLSHCKALHNDMNLSLETKVARCQSFLDTINEMKGNRSKFPWVVSF